MFRTRLGDSTDELAIELPATTMELRPHLERKIRLSPVRLRHLLPLTAVFMAAQASLASAADAKNVTLSQLPPAATTPVDFARDIEPLLAGRCFKCHGPEKQKADLRLDVPALALRGGDSGKVILPGKSAESKLIQLVAGLDPDAVMPPKGERLTATEVGV